MYRNFLAVFAVIVIFLLVSPAGFAAADDPETTNTTRTSRVPMPAIARGQGENCVEDTEFMRRHHMNMLKHQRDETVLKGVRDRQYSLKECIRCHAVMGPDAIPVTVSSPDHFCRGCHDYAAVKIDCFQCHASRPDIDSAHSDQAGTSMWGAGK